MCPKCGDPAIAFTALVDALWISLVALRPGNVLPGANLVLGLLGLTSTVGVAVRLWRARAQQKLSGPGNCSACAGAA